MKARQVLTICVLVLAAGWLVVLGARPTTAADATPAASAAVGRYQILADKGGAPMYLFDTATGQAWKHLDKGGGEGEWLGSVPPPKKK